MRWLKQCYTGYVKVRMTGGSPERFLNLCRGNGISLWNLTFEKEQYQFFLLLSDFFPDPAVCAQGWCSGPCSGKTGTALFFIPEPETKIVCSRHRGLFSPFVCDVSVYLEYQL